MRSLSAAAWLRPSDFGLITCIDAGTPSRKSFFEADDVGALRLDERLLRGRFFYSSSIGLAGQRREQIRDRTVVVCVQMRTGREARDEAAKRGDDRVRVRHADGDFEIREDADELLVDDPLLL